MIDHFLYTEARLHWITAPTLYNTTFLHHKIFAKLGVH
jgi:hypothetical protein